MERKLKSSSNKKINIPYLYIIILWGIFCLMRVYRNSLNYHSQTIGGIWNIISIIFVLLSILPMFGLAKNNFTNTINIAIIYSFFAIFHSLINFKQFTISNVYNIIMIDFFTAVLILFFIIGQEKRTKMIKITTITICFAIILLSFIGVFLYNTGKIDFVMVSNAYYALCVLPILLFITKNKFIIGLSFVSVGITIFFSNKRAALIAFILFVLVYSIFLTIQQRSWFKILRNLIAFIVFLVLFSVIYAILDKIYDLNIIERLFNLAKDGGSGRDIIYKQLLDAFFHSSIFEMIFGHGCNTTEAVLIIHDTAHCDFLEILYDYGIFPTALFILFYIYMIIDAFKMLKTQYEHASLFMGTIVISFMLSMFSTYCVSFGYVICGMAATGLILGDWQMQKGVEVCDLLQLQRIER